MKSKEFIKLAEWCLSRDVGFYIKWDKNSEWSIEINSKYDSKIMFFIDGCSSVNKALKKANKYCKNFKQ